MYVPRTCETTILEAGKSFPCIVVYGPRQVGKSTTIDHLFGGTCRQVTLDDMDDRNLALGNPKLFLETYGWPLIIDEIQKAPVLLDEIKKAIDRQRLAWMKSGEERRLMYILTGSNRFELQQGISDSLAGRCGIVDMASFSQAEKYRAEGRLFSPAVDVLLRREKELDGAYRTRSQVFEDIFSGGMPDIVTGVADREVYFKSYVSTYMEKDVRRLISAASELQFRNFLSIVALRTGQELHYDTIAGNVGIDARTCRKWISILETSGLVCLLQPYMANLSNRIIKTPKLYFMDTGLCAYLCRWPDSLMLEQCAMNGAFFETFVVSELVKNLQSHGKDPKEFLFYYRDIDRKEIDLLYADREGICPIEVKTGSSPRRPTKNFSVLKKFRQTVLPGLVIDTCDKMRPVNEEAWCCPVSLLGM